MDRKKFTDDAPGHLVEIGPDGPAFRPHHLPPKITLPQQTWELLAEARQNLGLLEGLGRQLPNAAILLRPLENREAIQSSRIEGTYATARELLLFERVQKDATSAESEKQSEWREVYNYRTALQQAIDGDLPISLRLIRRLHSTLMAGVRGREKTPGELRKIQVAIGTNYRFMPPPPQDVPECLIALESYVHQKPRVYDALVDCFLVHYQFETIHPFTDGNGRVGRLLLALMMHSQCGLSKPWIYMSAFYEKNRDEYIERMFNVSCKGDWLGWINFCLEGVIAQAKDTVSRCERLLQIKQGFSSRVDQVGGHIRLNKILDHMFNVSFVEIAELAKRLDVSYPTAKSDVNRLVRAGILKELPHMYPKMFYCPEVYNVAYEDLGDAETESE